MAVPLALALLLSRTPPHDECIHKHLQGLHQPVRRQLEGIAEFDKSFDQGFFINGEDGEGG